MDEQAECACFSDWSDWSDEELTRLLCGLIKILSANPYRSETEPYILEGVVQVIVEKLDERGRREWAWNLIDKWDEAS